MPATQKQNNSLILIIKAFVKTDARDTRPKYLQKALDLINLKLGIPCCVPVNLATELHGLDDNNFTNAVKNLLNTISVLNEKRTLTDAKTYLTNALNGCC